MSCVTEAQEERDHPSAPITTHTGSQGKNVSSLSRRNLQDYTEAGISRGGTGRLGLMAWLLRLPPLFTLGEHRISSAVILPEAGKAKKIIKIALTADPLYVVFQTLDPAVALVMASVRLPGYRIGRAS